MGYGTEASKVRLKSDCQRQSVTSYGMAFKTFMATRTLTITSHSDFHAHWNVALYVLSYNGIIHIVRHMLKTPPQAGIIETRLPEKVLLTKLVPLPLPLKVKVLASHLS